MRDRAWVAALAVAVLAIDQITKLMVIRWLPRGHSVSIVDGILSLTHVRNSGAAFGLFSNAPPGPVRAGLVIVSVLAVVLIWAYARDGWHDPSVVTAFGLILGGALGNLLDRLWRHEVVDFVDVYWGQYHWPSFNVADMAITMGAITLFVGMARQPQSDEDAPDQESSTGDGGRSTREPAEERTAEDVAGLG